MIEVPLNKKKFKGVYTLVDDADYVFLSRWNWSLMCSGYVFRKGKKSEGCLYRKTIYMHRQILGITDSKVLCDHINHNKLDNRRCNLRVCTSTQNQSNRILNRTSLSGYKGVSLKRVNGKVVCYYFC